MKRTEICLLVLFFLLSLSFTLSGCAGIEKLLGTGREEAVETREQVSPPGKYEDVSLDELLMPVIVLEYLNLSFDHFEQFVWEASTVFPEYLFYALGDDETGYGDGAGTILIEKDGGGEIIYMLSRALLKTEKDGSRWWQIHQTNEYIGIFYELLASPEGIPLKIRCEHPDTGKRIELVPQTATDYIEARQTHTMDDLKRQLQKERAYEIEHERSLLFHNPVLRGKERISTEGGNFRAFHIHDTLPDEELVVDYWISPEVPGRLVKILYNTSQGYTLSSVEVVKVKTGNTPRFGSLD